MLIQNAKAFIDGKFQEKTDLLIRDGRISAIGTGLAAEGEELLDLGGDLLLPGFVDVHIHAFKGMDAMQGEEAVRHMSRELKKVGVAAFLPTTMSASPEDTVRALAGVKAVMERPEPDGAIVLGAHMEAPFLAEAKAGAQLKQYFADPNEENWQRYTGGLESVVRLITMAPERAGAMEFISAMTKKGITVSIGHTTADAETTHAAAEAGATHVTHTFNAQTPLNHRAPGVPGAALVDDRLQCEVISDGIHLHPDIVKLIIRTKGKEKLVKELKEAARNARRSVSAGRSGGLCPRRRGPSEGRHAGGQHSDHDPCFPEPDTFRRDPRGSGADDHQDPGPVHRQRRTGRDRAGRARDLQPL